LAQRAEYRAAEKQAEASVNEQKKIIDEQLSRKATEHALRILRPMPKQYLEGKGEVRKGGVG